MQYIRRILNKQVIIYNFLKRRTDIKRSNKTITTKNYSHRKIKTTSEQDKQKILITKNKQIKTDWVLIFP